MRLRESSLSLSCISTVICLGITKSTQGIILNLHPIFGRYRYILNLNRNCSCQWYLPIIENDCWIRHINYELLSRIIRLHSSGLQTLLSVRSYESKLLHDQKPLKPYGTIEQSRVLVSFTWVCSTNLLARVIAELTTAILFWIQFRESELMISLKSKTPILYFILIITYLD